MQEFHGLKVLNSYSLFSYNYVIMLEISIKYLKTTHIFPSAMWHLPREIFDLAIENLDKVKRLKKIQRAIAEKKAFKWEVTINMRN